MQGALHPLQPSLRRIVISGAAAALCASSPTSSLRSSSALSPGFSSGWTRAHTEWIRRERRHRAVSTFFFFTRSGSKTADATVLSQRQKPRRMMEYWRQCALWLINCKVLPANHRVTWESAQVFDLAQTLRDGVLLCHLLNNLRPQTINLKEINLRPQMSQVRTERESANKQTELRRRKRDQTS